MAATVINPVKLVMNQFNDFPTTTALDATDGGLINWTGDDGRTVVIIENAGNSDADVTLKGGDGIQSANDVTVSVPAGGKKLVTLESGSFMLTRGTNKGKVHITGAVNAAAVIL